MRTAPALYVHEIGDGPPLVVVHGGPAYDHTYLRPELDRVGEGFRLVYYDQRGRGRSFSPDVAVDGVTIASEVDDLEGVRSASSGSAAVAILGHSWGALLAMEYALVHPDRVSHLVLVGSAPVSQAEDAVLRRQLAASGWPADFDRFAGRLRVGLSPEGEEAARAIQQRLYAETLECDGYDLVPRLRDLQVPTLVVHGDREFIPLGVAERIAAGIPGARLVVLPDCGHFPHVDQPALLRAAITSFCPVERGS